MAEYRIDVGMDASGTKAGKAEAIAALEAIKAAKAKEAAEQKAMMRRTLTDVEVHEKAKQAAIIKTNRERINAAKEALNAEKQGFLESSGLADKMIGAIGGLATQFGVLQMGTKVFDAVVTSMTQARDTIREAAKESTSLESSLREIAAMKGKLGQTGPEALANLKFRSQTLQTSDEVRAFQESMVGSGASAIGNLISQADFDKLAIRGGSMQAAEGGDAATHGQLAGMIPSLMGRKVTADEAFGKEQQLYNILQPGGSTFSSGTAQLLKNAPLVTSGVFKDVADMVALQSAFSLNNKGGAGENVQQFTRATVGGLGKLKGVQIEGDSQKVGQYLSGVKATDQMDPVQIGMLISADIAKKEAESAASGKTLNVMDYLKHQGYGNQEDILSLMAFHGLQKSNQYKTFSDLAKPGNAMGGGAAQADIDAFQAVNPVAQQRKGNVAGDLAKFNIGTGPEQYLENLRSGVFNAAHGTPGSKFTGTMEQWRDDNQWGGSNALSEEMIRSLAAEGGKVGVAAPGVDLRNRMYSHNEQEQASAFYEYALQVREKGGNIMPGMDGLLKNAEAQLKVQEQMRDAFIKSVPPVPAVPMPLNGPPAGLPARMP